MTDLSALSDEELQDIVSKAASRTSVSKTSAKTEAAWAEIRRRAELDKAEATTFHNELVIGERVHYTTEASWGTATGSGVYLGVALDEEDGVPFHYFVDGEINGHAQSCHGFAAAEGTLPTTELTPTQLIQQALPNVDSARAQDRNADNGVEV